MSHIRRSPGRTWMGLTAAAFVALATAMPAAAAQDEAPNNSGAASAGERITQVIVYGNDPCKVGEGDEIVVCVRRAERERYRIPPNLRDDPNNPKHEAWLNRSKSIEYVGASGAQSCSPVGGGGFTGCFSKIAAEAKAERKMLDRTDWGKLVAEERAKRLGNLDAESQQVEAQAKAEEAAQKAAEGGK